MYTRHQNKTIDKLRIIRRSLMKNQPSWEDGDCVAMVFIIPVKRFNWIVVPCGRKFQQATFICERTARKNKHRVRKLMLREKR